MTPLHTPRFTIRSYSPDDWLGLRDLARDQHATGGDRYDHPWPTDDAGAKAMAQWCASQNECFAVCLRDGGRLIGLLRFNEITPEGHLDLGHMFHSAYRDGHDTEAIGHILPLAFAKPEVTAVEGRNHPDWPGQTAPLIALGFTSPNPNTPGILLLTRQQWEQSLPR